MAFELKSSILRCESAIEDQTGAQYSEHMIASIKELKQFFRTYLSLNIL